MNPQEEKDLLSYLEGEIKYDEEKGLITIKDEPVIDIYGFGPKIYDHELGHFVTQLLINERERRKEQAKKVLLFCVVANEGEGMNQLSIWFEKYEDAKTFKESCIKRYPNCCIISKQYLITPKKEEE